VQTSWLFLALAAAALPAWAEDLADPIFDDTRIHEVRLEMKPADWSKLRARYLEDDFYPAVFRWEGRAVANVGVRSRGSGSRSGIKPGLRIDFDRYDKAQRFLGLESLVLDNGLQDPSYIKERISMRIFSRMGFAAPREAPARLLVNGQLVGLYTLVERIDETFVQRVFGDSGGDLYKYNWIDDYRWEHLGDDPTSYTPRFETKSANPDVSMLVDMIRTINTAPDDDFVRAASAHLDLSALVRYLAVEAFIGETDGITGYWGTNNFYLYRRAGRRDFAIIPWDKDYTFQDWHHPCDYNLQTNVLTRRVLAVPEFQREYAMALEEVARLSQGWLESQVHRMDLQVRGAAGEDPLRPPDVYARAINSMVDFARSRGPVVMDAISAMRVANRSKRVDPGALDPALGPAHAVPNHGVWPGRPNAERGDGLVKLALVE
jgi:hypothetical protein